MYCLILFATLVLLLCVWERFLQSFQLLGGYGDDGAVTWSEEAAGLCVLYAVEGAQVVGAEAELVVIAGVAIVHQAPVAVVETEYARTLNCLVGVLTPAWLKLPCASVVEILCDELLDALLTAAFSLEEDVVQALVVAHDVGVNAGVLHVEHQLWLTFKVGEVLVGVCPIDTVVGAAAVVGQYGEIHDVLASALIVDNIVPA